MVKLSMKETYFRYLAIDDVGDLYNIELQTYGLNEEILVRFELYNAELLRQQVNREKIILVLML